MHGCSIRALEYGETSDQDERFLAIHGVNADTFLPERKTRRRKYCVRICALKNKEAEVHEGSIRADTEASLRRRCSDGCSANRTQRQMTPPTPLAKNKTSKENREVAWLGLNNGRPRPVGRPTPNASKLRRYSLPAAHGMYSALGRIADRQY